MTKVIEIRNRIEAARIASGRSISWLARTTGINDKRLRRRLAAPHNFHLSELSAIVRALGITVSALFEPDAAAEG